MGMRTLRVGSVDVMVLFPAELARKVKTLGGLLSSGTGLQPGVNEVLPPVEKKCHSSPSAQQLQDRVDRIEWYHTIDLPEGVTTPGWFDLRNMLSRYPLPDRMDGIRVLDVATFDGFWAFEFERRGADVVALDVEKMGDVDICPRIRRTNDAAWLTHPTGLGFELCRQVLGSKVHREVLNVYDLSPERLGRFDIVFVSDLLLHLQNPMRALENVCSVTAGRAIIAETYHPALPDRMMRYESGEIHNTWWSFSFGALEQMVRDAGFARVELRSKFMLGYRNEKPILAHAAFEAFS